ncbi:LysR family transcriptional regulator [Pandoraea sp.]|uniref:LysR family transcriptional regulator n=1 Tax=Pandoraea sp. TaxID=1883445 RepID=UPI00121BF44D|nr:LysR family transcriptional regulator [Pandoraea sp.]TAL54862.1 MAG: LysR family transcriptional regulator [Pandoraea sp.]TAM18370.1 MAG: LysR family transcriptional regulator [Pandoraea sp.]
MELRHLRYFVTVARELHFSRAAAKLNIGQPPLSMQIRALEQELGVTLFERTRRRVFLTDAGRIFLARAEAILADVESAAHEARSITGCESGELRIGFTTSSPFTSLLQQVLSAYRKRFAQVTLTLHEMPSSLQVQAIEQRQLDIGLVRRPEHIGPAPSVQFSVLSNEALVLVLHRDHPLAGRRTVAIRELRAERFILHPRGSGTAIHHKIVQMCEHAGYTPTIVQEARESTTIVALVATGLGISILPAAIQCIQIDGVRYVRLSDADAISPLLLAHRHDDPSPLVRAFVELCAEHAPH